MQHLKVVEKLLDQAMLFGRFWKKELKLSSHNGHTSCSHLVNAENDAGILETHPQFLIKVFIFTKTTNEKKFVTNRIHPSLISEILDLMVNEGYDIANDGIEYMLL